MFRKTLRLVAFNCFERGLNHINIKFSLLLCSVPLSLSTIKIAKIRSSQEDLAMRSNLRVRPSEKMEGKFLREEISSRDAKHLNK